MKKAVKQSTLLMLLNVGTILLVILMATLFACSIAANNHALQMYSDEKELTLGAQQFIDASGYLTDQARLCAATSEKRYYDNYQTEVNTTKNREAGYTRMDTVGMTDSEKALISQMSELSNTLVPLEEAAMNNALSGNTDLAIQYVFGDEYTTNLTQIQSLQSQFLEAIDTRLTNEIEQQQRNIVMIQIAMIIFVAIIIVFQIFSTFFIKKKVISPLQSVRNEMLEFAKGNLSATSAIEADSSELGMLVYSVNKMRNQLKKYISDIRESLMKIAQGNLNFEPEFEYVGDFAQIQTSMKEISDSLRDTFEEIDTAANQVAMGADQVSIGAQALSQGATEQASAIEELSATAQDISNKISINAEHTKSADEHGKSAGEQLNSSSQKMQELVVAMDVINQKSNEIQRIVKTIDDIAFQTNILALNAAVEAARAGTAGKGFAVVADEVRNLAGKSAEASKTTQELIKDSVAAVAQGCVLVEDTANALQKASEFTEEVTAAISVIATASTEQAQTILQVTQGIDQISSVVQTNSATAEEDAAASEELSGQASKLKKLIEKFKMSEYSPVYQPAAAEPSPSTSFNTVPFSQNTSAFDKY